MIDPQGDQEIIRAQERMRATLEDWIPKILAAQEPDGYLQTAFTLRNPERWNERWSAQGRGDHEGYVAGYFLESAINHYLMTEAEGCPAVRRRQEARRLLGRQHRPARRRRTGTTATRRWSRRWCGSAGS